MPKQVQGMRCASKLADRLGLTGKLPLELDEIIVPTFQVGDISDEILGNPACATLAAGAGGAAALSEIELALPVTIAGMDQLEIWVEAVIVHPAGAVVVLLGESPGMAAPNLFGVPGWRDTGIAGNPMGALNGKNNAAAIAGFVMLRKARCPADVDTVIPFPYIIRKQSASDISRGLLIRANTLNVGIDISVLWRERPPR